MTNIGDLETNRDQLTRTAYTTVCRIMTQRTFFPNELRDVYVSISKLARHNCKSFEYTFEFDRIKFLIRLVGVRGFHSGVEKI